jgi:hypothetical protein
MFQEGWVNAAGSLRRPVASEQTPQRANQGQITASHVLILLRIC